ncbi:MAG: tetratricopeptide repeat protein, partial [Planctomycetota bacterium]
SPAAERAARRERSPREKPAPAASLEVELRCARAYELKNAERYSEAFEQLARAVQADPRDPRPLMGMAEIYRALDYDERAEEALRKALELDPGNAAAKVSLAMVLCDFGRNREALELLEELEKTRPDDPFIWAEIAINAVRLGDPKAAIPLLERYNEKVGRQAWGYENLGRAHFEAGNFEAAERCLREAIAINPRTALAHLWLGHLLTAQGRDGEAKVPLAKFRELRILQTQARLLEQAVNRSPHDVQALSRLAHVRTLLGRYKEALVPLERALEIAPDDDRVKRQIEYVRGLAKGGGR